MRGTGQCLLLGRRREESGDLLGEITPAARTLIRSLLDNPHHLHAQLSVHAQQLAHLDEHPALELLVRELLGDELTALYEDLEVDEREKESLRDDLLKRAEILLEGSAKVQNHAATQSLLLDPLGSVGKDKAARLNLLNVSLNYELVRRWSEGGLAVPVQESINRVVRGALERRVQRFYSVLSKHSVDLSHRLLLIQDKGEDVLHISKAVVEQPCSTSFLAQSKCGIKSVCFRSAKVGAWKEGGERCKDCEKHSLELQAWSEDPERAHWMASEKTAQLMEDKLNRLVEGLRVRMRSPRTNLRQEVVSFSARVSDVIVEDWKVSDPIAAHLPSETSLIGRVPDAEISVHIRKAFTSESFIQGEIDMDPFRLLDESTDC